MSRVFNPWIGSNYQTSGLNGLRILILGEAHYGKEGEAVPAFTGAIIRKLGQNERFKFYTVLQKLVENKDGYVTNEERKAFWENVSFYNFIQKFPGATARIRPTPTMWEEAIQPYLETLAELKPHLVVVVGFDLRNHLPADPEGVHFCKIQHPSSGHFDTPYWKGVIATAIATTRKKQAAESGASPNGGPAEPLDNSNGGGGPPSVN